MSKSLFVMLTAAVTMAGQEVKAGEVLELSEISANALVKEGRAEFAEPTAETAEALQKGTPGSPESPTDGEKVEEGTNSSSDDKTLSEGSQAPLTGSDIPSEDEVEKITRALEAQYKAPELKAEAKKVGVDFAYDATKPEVIEAIIEQGKAAELLK